MQNRPNKSVECARLPGGPDARYARAAQLSGKKGFEFGTAACRIRVLPATALESVETEKRESHTNEKQGYRLRSAVYQVARTVIRPPGPSRAGWTEVAQLSR